MTSPTDLLLHTASSHDNQPCLDISPESAEWAFVGLRVIQLAAGDAVALETAEDEICIVPLIGKATVRSVDSSWTIQRLGGLFEAKPTALYLPIDTIYSIVADVDSEIAITSSRATERFQPKLIPPDEIDVEIRGAGNAARQINHIMKPNFPAHKLLVVEVYTPSGNWSSFPPHKHDVQNLPEETILEEIYYYRIDPPDGFGLQRLYTADASFDQAWVIKDGDALLVPEGYHAFCIAHGYTAYYLNVLAGPDAVRSMQPADDPQYAWVRDTWTDDQNGGAETWSEIDGRVNKGAGRRLGS